MSPTSLIPAMQSDALAREVQQELKDESSAIMTAAQSGARATISQARSTARSRVHAAIAEMRREGPLRLARAKAQLETDLRAHERQQAARAIAKALPLLRDALNERWRDARDRRSWTDEVARLAVARLHHGNWLLEHPPDWTSEEQKAFIEAMGSNDGIEIAFDADKQLTAGLRIKADQATLDATPEGLLADAPTIVALLLDELGDRTE